MPLYGAKTNKVTVAHKEIACFTPGSEVSPEAEIGQKMVGRRTLKCAWSQAWLLAQQLLGQVNFVGGQIVFMHPQQFPYPSNPGQTVVPMYAKHVKIKPYAAPGQGLVLSSTLNWAEAILEVSYEAPQSMDSSGMLWKEDYNPTAEFITLPAIDATGKSILAWNSGGTDFVPPSASPGVEIRKAEWVVSWFKAPVSFYAFAPGITEFVNCVNNTAIYSDSFGQTFAPGTLRYDAPHLEKDRFSDGSAALQISMHFQHNPMGWNKFPNIRNLDGGGNPTWGQIYVKQSWGTWAAYKPFMAAELNGILPWNL